MDNRFGFKDFIVIVLLIGVIVSVWFSMKQYDRQWDDIRLLAAKTDELTASQAQTNRKVDELRAMIERGVVSAGPATDAAPIEGAYDPHAGVRAARLLPGFAQGDWCIDSFGTNLSVITALTYKDLYGRLIQSQVLESLISIDSQTLEIVPLIARSWRIEDNSKAWRAYRDAAEAELGARADADASVYMAELDAVMKEAKEESSEAIAPGSERELALRADARKRWIEAQIKADPKRPPALTITFQLRKDVVFSDGVPLTSADVVFSFELLNNPELDAASQRQFYDNVETCKATGPYEVVYTTAEPHYMALSMCGGQEVLPRHFYERFTIAEINKSPGLLLGSGPYRLADPTGWAPGKPLELVRNERYWGPQGGFSKVLYREIVNDVARVTAFKNGEIDMITPTAEQYKAMMEDPALVARTQQFAYQAIPSGYMWLAWQQKRNDRPTQFADKRVRQAMTYLTERERLAKDVFHGYAVPAVGPWPRGSNQCDPGIEPYPYDPKKGIALLKEAGFEDRNGDGVLDGPDGKPFRFKLTYPSNSADYERIVLFLKDSYARVGIVLEPDPLEFSVMLQRLDQQTFDAIILRWGGGAIESDIRQMFHSSQTNKGGDNVMNYVNPELDRLIDQARTTIDPDQRYPLWHKCHRILHDDQPYTFMVVQQTLRFIDGRIENVKRNTMGINDPPRNEWFVPLGEQKWGL